MFLIKMTIYLQVFPIKQKIYIEITISGCFITVIQLPKAKFFTFKYYNFDLNYVLLNKYFKEKRRKYKQT